MKVRLVLDDGTKLAVRNEDGLPFAFVDAPCPKCGAPAPFKIAGRERHIHSRDTYAAKAQTLCCKAFVGTLYATVDTIFGLEEDEAVLVNGRARVYDGAERREGKL